jgi:hypothetical protein
MTHKPPTTISKMSSNRNSMKSQSNTSSNGNKFAVLEEKGEKVPYVQLWNEAIDMGLIGEDRESTKEYYHMVYRKSLIQAMSEYRAAKTEKAKKDLAAKFESNLANECKKKDMWEDALEEGMIYECYPSEGHHYTSYKLEDLEKHFKSYRALKDEDKRVAYAVTFEKSLKSEGPAKKEEAPVKRPAAPAMKGASFSKVVASSSVAYPALPSQPTKVVQPAPQQDSPLARCWQRGLAMNFIHPRNVFHQGLLSFITFSELDCLLKEFSVASPATKTEMAVQFMEELDYYEKDLPPVSKCFGTNRSYSDIWKKADKQQLIPEDVEYKAEYAEWLSPHDLLGFCQTVSTLTHKKDRATVRQILSQQILERIEEANSVLDMRKNYCDMKAADLIKEADTVRPSSRQTSYANCETCNAKLVHADLAFAVTSWIYLTEGEENELAKARYLRWHSYRKQLHSECPK